MADLVNTFTFEGGSTLRTIMRSGEPWFVAADACAVLEHSNAREAIRGLDEDEKCGVSIPDAIGREQETNLISESGLYTLILRSRKPQAKPFRRWVTHEVLPALRRTGSYDMQSDLDYPPTPSTPLLIHNPTKTWAMDDRIWLPVGEAARRLNLPVEWLWGITCAYQWDVIEGGKRMVPYESLIRLLYGNRATLGNHNGSDHRGVPTHVHRMKYARAAIEGYRKARREGDPKQQATDIVCLLADMENLARLEGLNWSDLSFTASTRAKAFRDEPPRPAARLARK